MTPVVTLGSSGITRHCGVLYLHAVESMVRLGQKYQIGYLYEEGQRCLQRQFPCSLSRQEQIGRDEYEISNFGKFQGHQLRSLFTIIELSHECGLQTVLPSLYLHVLLHPVVSSILLIVSSRLKCTYEGEHSVPRRGSVNLFGDDSRFDLWRREAEEGMEDENATVRCRQPPKP